MRAILIKGGRVITPTEVTNADLLIEKGKIITIRSGLRVSHAQTIKASGLYVSPGFIDTHVNGGGGRSFMECESEAFQTVFDFHSRHGTTGMLPTAVPAPLEQMRKFLQLVAHFRSTTPIVLGAHLNGPFVSPQMAGAIDARYILKPSVRAFHDLVKGVEHAVKIVTLAPEEPGAQELIGAVISSGAIPSLGHSNATYEETNRAISWGVRHFTHFFNAMRGLHHREPGAVGAGLNTDRVTMELIADGVHVHEAAINVLLKIKGINSILLVTDATSATGLTGGRYSLGSTSITVQNGIARTDSGTLAGSTLTMERALANLCRFAQLDLITAVKTVSLNPATLLGINNETGSLEVGKDANIVLFSDNFQVHYTLLQGKIMYVKERA